jgi:hypothetical protein
LLNIEPWLRRIKARASRPCRSSARRCKRNSGGR